MPPIVQGQFAILTSPLTVFTLGSVPALGNTVLLVVGTSGAPPQAIVSTPGLTWTQIAEIANGGGSHQFAIYQAGVDAIAGAVITVATPLEISGYAAVVELPGPVGVLTTARAAAVPASVPAPTRTFTATGLVIDGGDAYRTELAITDTLPPPNPG